jgi:histidinol-phosphate aminotransferase
MFSWRFVMVIPFSNIWLPCRTIWSADQPKARNRWQKNGLCLRSGGLCLPVVGATGIGQHGTGHAATKPEISVLSDNPFSHLVPPHILNFPAYVPGKPIEEVVREFGLATENIVKLASNENPLGISPAARAAAIAALDDVGRYPDSHGHDLRQALVRKLGVEAGQIILGNGSSDLISMVTAAFLDTNTSVVCSQYAFSAYFSSSRVQGATMCVAPARDFGHDPEAMLKEIRADTRLVFIANPNNPTGTALDEATLRDLIRRIPADVIVVLDEAYREYQSPEARIDSVAWIADHPNLLIFRTLSKAYGLAGLRIGYGVGSVHVADLVNRVRQTFNCNLIAQAAAIAALDDEDHLRRTYELNRDGLVQLYTGLDALGLSYVHSAGNFVMAEVPDGIGTYRALLQQGVIVRPLRPNYGLTNYLRVTVGTERENARFLEALETVLAPATDA